MPVERYQLDDFLSPPHPVRVLRQSLRSAHVHWHDFYELVYVLDGRARHVVNGVEHSLAPGDAFLMTPADFHEITASGSLECYNVLIDPSLLSGELGEVLAWAGEPTAWIVPGFSEGEADFRRLWSESEANRPGASRLMLALLVCIVVGLARRVGEGQGVRPRPSTDPGMRRAILFVDHNFREPITLADVARQAHLSPNYVSERFHEITGQSFQSYVQQRRLRFAHSLLRATDLGVSEVCRAAGFNSLSHFGRAYRRRYGCPPSAHKGS
ncbi:MAG TPA: AraC family transcriptional regulator [Actinopolymorphaceae bacterium]|jgi:AraC-like DNA-binding protein/mannose-6-phosphate isomerase-like protein (cupin superfamily)